MYALIIAGGQGLRLGLLSEKSPKSLVRLGNGERILQRQLKQLVSARISEITIITGYKDQDVRSYCSEHFNRLST